MIQAEKLSKEFYGAKGEKILAVNELSFEIQQGEVFGLLGHNGAGKTTLLRMLGLILEPTEGEVRFEDKRVLPTDTWAKKKIGYLSGNTKLYGKMSPMEVFNYIGALYDVDKQTLKKNIDYIVDYLNMGAYIDKHIERLSTGQTQKVSLARTIVTNPDIYIFDEPTSGLDIVTTSNILAFINDEKQKGKTIIFSTHYIEEAESLCDRVALMKQGKVFETGSIDEIVNRADGDSIRDIFIKSIEGEDDNE